MIITNCPRCGAMNATTTCNKCGWSEFTKSTVSTGARVVEWGEEMSERLGMKCKRCGDNEDRIDGFCTIECRDKFYLEEDIAELTTRIAELEAERRWVPVSERLPEDRATILAAFKNREILTATYYKHYEGFGGVENYWHIEGWHSGEVTHWMPLPETPEECER